MPQPKKKILIIVMDGMGDRACHELRGFTPLQYVRTPNLDWFVEHGISGLCDPISPGIRAGSDTAHLSILGYDPYECYFGRGPYEAAGVGLKVEPGDVAFRCNFATVDNDMEIMDRRAGKIAAPETTQLAQVLDGMVIDSIECRVVAGNEHRAVLLLKGPGLSPNVTDCDPEGNDYVGKCTGLDPEAEYTAEIVNTFVERSHGILKGHLVNRKRMATGLNAANYLLPRGAGICHEVQPFTEKYDMSASCVAGIALVRGLCSTLGMDVAKLPPQCNGTLHTDMITKVRIALEELEDHDFVIMNIKAPDIAGHLSDARAKCDAVKNIDVAASILRNEMPDDLVVVLTCDHSTPCSLTDHSGDPVPIAIYTSGIIRDDATEFSETGCAKGSVGRIRSRDIMPICMDLANRTAKFGS